MPQEINLNVSPYYDDFDAKNNYHRVLVKPSTPVQAREINNLQSILQNQVESLGNHFFKEGSKVIPGQTSYNRYYNAVELENTFSGVDLESYLNFLVGKTLIGESSGIEAIVNEFITSKDSERNNATIYVEYISASNVDNERITFIDGENLLTLDSFITPTTAFDTKQAVAKTISLNCNSLSSSFKVSEGVYYLRGHFVLVQTQSIILDQYSNNPSYKIGFIVNEELITSDLDPNLTDNAKGFNNYAAPGADRLKLTANLAKKELNDNTIGNFVEIAQIQDGIIRNTPNDPIYNIIEDKFAKRTFDESGDYYVKRFDVNCLESLNDRKGNNGIFLGDSKTYQGNTPSKDLAIYKISPGKAYIRGYSVEINSPTFLDIEKPRTLKTIENEPVVYSTGATLSLNRLSGSPEIGIGNTFTISLRNERIGINSIIAAGEEIGFARVYDFALEEGSYQTQLDANKWDITLYDIQPFTRITLNQPITLQTPSYFIGNSSGATGFLKDNVSNSTNITLYNVTGNFITNESFTIDSVRNSRIGIAVTNYDISNVKSVYGESTFGIFNADVVQSNAATIGVASISAATGNTAVISFLGTQFINVIKPKDLLKFSLPSQSALPEVVIVDSITTNNQLTNVTVQGITTVQGVYDGGLPASAVTITDLELIKTNLFTGDQARLYTPLSRKNVNSVDLKDSNITIRRQYKTSITSNSTPTINAENNYTFLPFDEERYSLVRSNGKIEALSIDKFDISADGKQLKINGLGLNDTNTVLITTQKKTNVTSKVKSKARVASLIVDKSSLSSSGIGTTTRNDNLTFGNFAFGTRVQDSIISLNVPDAIVVHGIFEAQNLEEPSAPIVTLSNISATNTTQNIILGEEFIGRESGAVAICAEITNNDKIAFIYKNQSEFQLNEIVEFSESKITANVNQISNTSKNITKSFDFDNGQRESFYDYSRIVRKSNALEPQSKIKIYFDYLFYSPQDTGDITTASSYLTFDYKNDIQIFNGNRNTDVIDIRPRVSNYSVASNKRSPFEFNGRTFEQVGNSSPNILASDEAITIGFDFYLPRIDRIFLDKDGKFIVQKGIPDEEPLLPQPFSDSLEIAKIYLPPFLYDVSNANITEYDYKRYQMSDISKLETRIKNLEQYTTLSLLETETSNLFISDASLSGLNRFKSGFFVDNFKTLIPQEERVGIRNSIDPISGGLRPAHYTNSIDLIIGTKDIIGAGTTTNIDYSSITTEDILGQNIQKTGDIVTLKYDHVVWLDQPFATKVENVQPYILSYWEGNIKLNPSSDIWVDVVRLNPKTIQIEGDYIATMNRLALTNGVNPQTGIGPVIWGSWSFMGFGNPRWVRQSPIPTQFFEVVDAIYNRSGTKTLVTESFDTKSLGDSVVSIDVIPNMRSRNVEFISSGLQRNVKVYPFFDGINVSDFCFPKLIEISMISGSFSIGERVRIESQRGTLNSIEGYFRIAAPNHKSGKFDAPVATYSVEPYGNTAIPTLYSSSSTIVNVDTSSLALKSQGQYYGRIQNNYNLIGESSGAIAKVNNLRLISDTNGEIIGSFFIPDPNVPENPTFAAGTKIFKITTNETNNPIPGIPLSQGESRFFAEGKLQTLQEKVLSIRNANVVTETFTDKTSAAVFTGLYIDPLAQSFACDEATGTFLTKIDVFFQSKDPIIPVTCQIRTMELGTPTKTILPFSNVILNPDKVNISADGSIPTTFTFESPVYIEKDQEYAIVLISNSTSYRVWISRLGQRDTITENIVETQPTLGSLFKSQNASTWTPTQEEDLKFKLYRAEFNTNPGFINFYNPDLSEGNDQIATLINNPLDLISRSIRVSLSSTITDSDSNFKFGQTVIQPSTNAKGVYVSKVGIATGGTSNGGLSIPAAGIGYTPSSGAFTYNNVALTAITGTGRNATANITISNGVAIGATIVNGGTGYQIGDVLSATQIGSNTLGRNLKLSVGIISQFNEIILDNVQGNFVGGVGIGNSLSYYNSSNTLVKLNSSSGSNVTINSPIQIQNDGLHFRVKHLNHGMHSPLNYVVLKDVRPDTPAFNITNSISNTTSNSISVNNSVNFETFEGYPVTENNPGYVLINNEIIKYTSVTNNSLNNITRGIDSTIVTNHAANSLIFKYELNGVSLLRINRIHKLEDTTINDPIGLDYYSLKISQNNESVGSKFIADRTGSQINPALYFNTTKSDGGNFVKATQNMQFELITPEIETFIPNNTNITTQVRTVSGTSISGNELSFIDKGFTPITINEYNYFDSPRIIASKINESNNLTGLPGNKSFNVVATLTSNDSRISPCLDLTRNSVVTTTNRVNKIIADNEYIGDNRANSLSRDQTAFIYVSKPYKFKFPATSIKLLVSADINSYSDIRALYSIDTQENTDPIFELFPGYKNIDSLGNTIDISQSDGTPDVFSPPNNILSFEPQNYFEYEFTANNLPSFTHCRIKLILTSTNQAYVPKIKDIRAIALA